MKFSDLKIKMKVKDKAEPNFGIGVVKELSKTKTKIYFSSPLGWIDKPIVTYSKKYVEKGLLPILKCPLCKGEICGI
jgi:hypothetical protein